MNRRLVPLVAAALVAVLVFSLVPAPADARVETRVHSKMGGALGRVANLFAGKQAREGIVTVEMVSGDRMLTRTGRTGQLVDLGEEKTWRIDFKRGRVTDETSFDEIREAFARVREGLAGGEGEGSAVDEADESGDATPQVELEVSVEDTGETDEILGYEARKKKIRVVAHPVGTTLEEGGGAVLEADIWLGPELEPLEEIEAFQRRYAAAVGLPGSGPGSENPAVARDAALGRVLAAFDEATSDWKGSPLRTRMSLWTVGGEAEEGTPSLSGMLGRLRKKRKKEPQEGPPGSRLVFQVESEVTAVSSEVPAGALDPPGKGS